MIDSEFNITYSLLNALNDYDHKVGKINSFFAVHIAGGFATAITLGLDTLVHLIACVTKVATGIIATPYCYFTDSPDLENWTWSSAGKHYTQAFEHAAGFLVGPPTTLFFSPDAALNLLFPEKVELRRLQEELKSAQNKSEQDPLSADDLQPQIEEGQGHEQRSRFSSEIQQLKADLEKKKDEVIRLQKQNAIYGQSRFEDSNDEHIINKLQTALDNANDNVLSLEFQIKELSVLNKESQSRIDDLNTQLKKVDEKTFKESQKKLIETHKKEIDHFVLKERQMKLELNKKDGFIENQKREIIQLKNKNDSPIPDLLKSAFDDLDKMLECPIDSEYLTNAAFVVPCGHKFNAVSLKEHLEKSGTCPSCSVQSKESNIDYQTREIAKKVEEIQGIIQKAMETI